MKRRKYIFARPRKNKNRHFYRAVIMLVPTLAVFAYAAASAAN